MLKVVVTSGGREQAIKLSTKRPCVLPAGLINSKK